MKHTNTQTHGTPESRNELRMKALPMLLALELAEMETCHSPEELISHEDLETAMVEKLGLEPSELGGYSLALSGEINQLMYAWNWQCFTFDGGMLELYARPETQWARSFTLWGNDRLLQSGQCFPRDHECVAVGFWESDFAEPFLQEHAYDALDCRHEAGMDVVVINSYLKAHMISHQLS
ncbi:hypothetical protein [Halocynthiibacter styelae]|uniref:Uncharacterized protein n=1 Tax=Halocynthiibacter styelae TaxID=2761955 RepID=A0A8J7IU72_9RHOB|nr:hypothetical protein [Paenihalocynthiibacter styelae]MBI1493174.1 hypothetical protein [Paenihalocynthiibacter styelae]